MAPRGSYHHGNLKRALLDAALALFAERGNLDFTMRELGRRAGVTHNAPYRHFAGKEALRATLAAEGYGLLKERLAGASKGATGPRSRIRALGEAYVRFPLEKPHHFHLMMTTPLGPAADPELVQAAVESFAELERAIAKGRSSGVLRQDFAAKELALVAWSLVHGVAALLFGGLLPSDEGAVRSVAALLGKAFFEGTEARGVRPKRGRRALSGARQDG